jgi:AAA domain, putative AbiEii toxin, Type IV TA system
MITSFEARWFRPFEHIEVNDLRGLNILVGRSASGKTALLEGIRLALAGTPHVAANLNAARGLWFIQQNPSREQFESIWAPLFFAFDTKGKIELRVTDAKGSLAAVSISFDGAASPGPALPLPPTNPVITTSIVPIVFRRQPFVGEETVLVGRLDQGGNLQLDQGAELAKAELFSGAQVTPVNVASWFSQLSIANDDADIIQEVSRNFPEIESLSVQAPLPFPSIYATLAHQSRKVPISLISSGLNKFLSLLVLIQTFRDGVVLIDEIENGIYFEMFPDLWQVLHRFAMQNRTQLFLSTHSLECIRGAAATMEKFGDDFSLLQIVRENGRSKAYRSAGNDVLAAIETGIELRR